MDVSAVAINTLISDYGAVLTHNSGHKVAPILIFNFPKYSGYQLAIRKNKEKLSLYMNAKTRLGNSLEQFLSEGEIEQRYPNNEKKNPANSLLSENDAQHLTPKRNKLFRINVRPAMFSSLVERYLDIGRQEVSTGNQSVNNRIPFNETSNSIDIINDDKLLEQVGISEIANLSVSKGSRLEVSNNEEGISEADDTTSEIITPAGYQTDPVKRKAIEDHAMDRAAEHYRDGGFAVEQKGKPYDLNCTKEDLIVHVEVKGTTGKGDAVILTRNEVKHARDKNWRSDLFILCNIALNPDGQPSGGEVIHLENWEPDEKDLEPIAFNYTVPK